MRRQGNQYGTRVRGNLAAGHHLPTKSGRRFRIHRHNDAEQVQNTFPHLHLIAQVGDNTAFGRALQRNH